MEVVDRYQKLLAAAQLHRYTAGLVKFPMAVEKRSGGGTHGKE
jgi:hypothetical protein